MEGGASVIGGPVRGKTVSRAQAQNPVRPSLYEQSQTPLYAGAVKNIIASDVSSSYV